MQKIKRKILIGALSITLLGTTSNAFAWTYQVQPGDTYWKLSQRYGVSLESVLKANNAGSNTNLNVGDKITIPDNIFYYTVKSGDTPWIISQKFGVSVDKLLQINNLNKYSVIYVGQNIMIPNTVQQTTNNESKYGEYLDWWNEAQYVVPREAQFKVIDFYTGKSFNAKRTVGSNHADVETLTTNDTNIMKSIWGGDFSWVRRPVIIEYNGRRIAASATAMPHAGNDGAAGGSYTTWRSGGYGAGTNFDYIKGNGMDGHFDIHFLNSTRHKDGQIDEQHQECVKIAAGLIK